MGEPMAASRTEGGGAVPWPTEAPRGPDEDTEEEQTGGLFNYVSAFAESSGAASAWRAWMKFTNQYCNCAQDLKPDPRPWRNCGRSPIFSYAAPGASPETLRPPHAAA
mmetsp:Transcript_30529/g.57159  ORF Transcript_30529/g.57159 Transcript_30529/m.57159 type:complete len:108 (+) Transcript_30529:64-387(+)